MPWQHLALPHSAQEFKKGLQKLRNSALTLQGRESDTQVGRWCEDPQQRETNDVEATTLRQCGGGGKLHPDDLAHSLSFSPIPSYSYTSSAVSFECLSSPIPLFPWGFLLLLFCFLPYSFLVPSRQPSASLTYLLPPVPSTLTLYPGWSSWKQGQIHQSMAPHLI